MLSEVRGPDVDCTGVSAGCALVRELRCQPILVLGCSYVATTLKMRGAGFLGSTMALLRFTKSSHLNLPRILKLTVAILRALRLSPCSSRDLIRLTFCFLLAGVDSCGRGSRGLRDRSGQPLSRHAAPDPRHPGIDQRFLVTFLHPGHNKTGGIPFEKPGLLRAAKTTLCCCPSA